MLGLPSWESMGFRFIMTQSAGVPLLACVALHLDVPFVMNATQVGGGGFAGMVEAVLSRFQIQWSIGWDKIFRSYVVVDILSGPRKHRTGRPRSVCSVPWSIQRCLSRLKRQSILIPLHHYHMNQSGLFCRCPGTSPYCIDSLPYRAHSIVLWQSPGAIPPTRVFCHLVSHRRGVEMW